jgi:hypothetical protein
MPRHYALTRRSETMCKMRITAVFTFATLLSLAVVVAAPIDSTQRSPVKLMSEAEMVATFGDNLIDYEAISKPCEIVQILGTSSCHYCFSEASRKVCCACGPQQSGLCTDTTTLACNGSTCFLGSIQTGPPSSCGVPPCGKSYPTGTCGAGGGASVCPTYDKTGSCTAPPQ